MKNKTGTRREAAKRETRRIILDAAYDLFEAKGYDKTTMRALAAKAGVGLGTIFQHFPSKEFLMVEAFWTDVGGVVDEAMTTLPEKGLISQLVHISKALYDFYLTRPLLARRLVGVVYQVDGEAYERILANFHEFLTMVGALIEDARAKGELESELNVEDLTFAYWSYYYSCLFLLLWSPKPDLQEQLERLERLLDNLFRKP